MKWLSISLLILLLTLLLGSSLKVYRVKTESMSEAIVPGDYVIVLKKNLLMNFKSGNIISFRKTEGGKENVVFIKRLIAQSGDTILSSEAGLTIHSNLYPHDSLYDLLGLTSDTVNTNYLYLNFLTKGKPTPEIVDSASSISRIIVTKNSYFLIGDNYYRSMDSRVWGFIEQDHIIGKVIAII